MSQTMAQKGLLSTLRLRSATSAEVPRLFLSVEYRPRPRPRKGRKIEDDDEEEKEDEDDQ